MPLQQLLLLNLIAIMLVCVVLWLISLIRRDASIVDIFWGIGFVIVAGAAFVWAVRNGQFEDLEGEGSRMLFDDEPVPPARSQAQTPARGEES